MSAIQPNAAFVVDSWLIRALTFKSVTLYCVCKLFRDLILFPTVSTIAKTALAKLITEAGCSIDIVVSAARLDSSGIKLEVNYLAGSGTHC